MEQHGWVWLLNQQRPICEVHEISRGKNKGKLRVTLCRGRNVDGTIKRGGKRVVPFDNLIEFPEQVT